MPLHKAALESVARMPEEFERRWWSSHVDAIIEKVRTDYDNYRSKASTPEFLKAQTLINITAQLLGSNPLPGSVRVGVHVFLAQSGSRIGMELGYGVRMNMWMKEDG